MWLRLVVVGAELGEDGGPQVPLPKIKMRSVSSVLTVSTKRSAKQFARLTARRNLHRVDPDAGQYGGDRAKVIGRGNLYDPSCDREVGEPLTYAAWMAASSATVEGCVHACLLVATRAGGPRPV
jgi:hypothetical protein